MFMILYNLLQSIFQYLVIDAISKVLIGNIMVKDYNMVLVHCYYFSTVLHFENLS